MSPGESFNVRMAFLLGGLFGVLCVLIDGRLGFPALLIGAMLVVVFIREWIRLYRLHVSQDSR